MNAEGSWKRWVGGWGERGRGVPFSCIRFWWWHPTTTMWRFGCEGCFQCEVCTSLCVSVFVCVGGGSVGWLHWCQMGAGGRTVSQLSSKGGWTTRCICVYVRVCMWTCRACRVCIGRGSSACHEVIKHTHTDTDRPLEGMETLPSDGTR